MNRNVRDKTTPPQAQRLKDPAVDITSEEKFYNRSMKVRIGVKDCLYQLAKDRSLTFDSLEAVGGYCGNYITSAGWLRQGASSVSCVRWIKQYIMVNGHFKLKSLGSGTFQISFRSPEDRSAALREINEEKAILRKSRKAAQKAPYSLAELDALATDHKGVFQT